MDSATAFKILITNSDSFASVFTRVLFSRAPANFERTLNKRWGSFTRNLWRGKQWCIQYREVPFPRRGYLSGELKQCWYNTVTIFGNHKELKAAFLDKLNLFYSEITFFTQEWFVYFFSIIVWSFYWIPCRKTLEVLHLPLCMRLYEDNFRPLILWTRFNLTGQINWKKTRLCQL